MRCPYCGGVNTDQASYCTYCGRDLTPQSPYQQVLHQQPPNTRVRQVPPTPPIQQQRQAPPQGRPVPPSQNQQTFSRSRATDFPEAPRQSPALEAPAPFPPRTVAQLEALVQGALPYTLVNSTVTDGRKKIVRIFYAKGVAWQQVATLYKAFKEQEEKRFDTIIIQGVFEQDTQVYAFTNGQLYFDRNVRLGSLTMNRYQIETGTGFESDSVRIVLSE